jgi:hypothetical protein
MMILRRAAGVALGLGALAAIVKGAYIPMTLHLSDQGLLRLAWSARPERIERCRRQSEEELARLPAHMRQPVLCEGASAQYRLTVRDDGRLVAEQVVHGGGLRQDRRLYVFQELPLDPGDRRIEVRFDRLDSEGADSVNRQSGGETVPAHLAFDQRVRVRPREVILVTYSPERQALVGIQDVVQPTR